jgi:hypothetical protein
VSGKFARQHAAALAKVKAKGAPAVFTLPGQSTYDRATDITTPGADVVVPCYAIEVGKNPILYQALGLVMAQAPTLEAVPETYGDTPPMGSSVLWGGTEYVTKSVSPLAPDGVTILAKCVVSR